MSRVLRLGFSERTSTSLLVSAVSRVLYLSFSERASASLLVLVLLGLLRVSSHPAARKRDMFKVPKDARCAREDTKVPQAKLKYWKTLTA